MFLLKKNLSVIYVSDIQLAIAEFQMSRNGPEVKAHHYFDLPANVISHGAIKDKIEFEKQLKRLLSEIPEPGISSKEVIFILPEQQIYMSVLHFTSSKLPEQILEEVPREALSTIPLDPRNIYCDFFHVPSSEKRHEVMYVAADKHVVDTYLELLIKAGLSPVAIITEPDALLATTPALSEDKESSLILSIGKRRSYWIMSEGGSIKKIAPSKLISSVGNIASDEAVDMLQAEAQVVLSGFQANEEKHTNVKQIFLWADVDPAGSLSALVQKMANILHMDVFAAPVQFQNKPTILQKLFGGFLVNDLNERKIRTRVDLLPKSLKDQATLLLINKFITIFSIMVMLAASGAISVFSYAWSEMYFENQRAQREAFTANGITADTGATRYAEIKKKTLNFNAEVDALTRIQATLFSYHTIWESLRSVVFSDTITATSIEYGKKDLAMRITGIASTRDDLARFKKKLEALPFVLEVVSPLSNLDKTNNISFLFTVKLNPKKLPYLSN